MEENRGLLWIGEMPFDHHGRPWQAREDRLRMQALGAQPALLKALLPRLPDLNKTLILSRPLFSRWWKGFTHLSFIQ